MIDHPAKTLLGDRVLYYKCPTKTDYNPQGHVAFVIQVNSDHNANLVCYCPVSHSWFEATSVPFGVESAGAGGYFVNPEG